jgi:hypothetical protein
LDFVKAKWFSEPQESRNKDIESYFCFHLTFLFFLPEIVYKKGYKCITAGCNNICNILYLVEGEEIFSLDLLKYGDLIDIKIYTVQAHAWKSKPNYIKAGLCWTFMRLMEKKR